MAVLRPPHLLHRVLRWTAAEGVVRHERVSAFGVRFVAALRNALAGPMPARQASGNRSALGRALHYLPQLAAHEAQQSYYPATGAQRGRVALFLGCVARHLDQQTTSAAVHLLTQWGYEVHIPPTQACCGALYVHDGAPKAAQRLLQANLEAFSRHEVQALVTTATGCAATLLEYPRLAGADPALRTAANRLADKVVDISRFLAGEPWPQGVSLTPRPGRVAVHEPCTLRHAMGPAPGVCDLLRRIPNLDVVRLPAALRCCGAAGTNMLTHPAIADALAFDTLDVVAEIGADSLVTSNIGCALHLAAALRARGRDTEVLHAARFLSRQLVRRAG
ncbi:MAG: (Fe-S)-binding protein [Gammaproteobacteria bacterium]|nr:(Fe-S)-binding protein [Gammaproteobacteria bacterium]